VVIPKFSQIVHQELTKMVVSVQIAVQGVHHVQVHSPCIAKGVNHLIIYQPQEAASHATQLHIFMIQSTIHANQFLTALSQTAQLVVTIWGSALSVMLAL
jgi:AMMECR1 domain-containing protein